ncbi:fimbrial protein, partial [Pseudomonas viridiflava]|uniref:fimbrial protein n=1 Tax=Pseudomonas viridiflava TaxID=33069 RepID=UPI003C6DF072
GDWDRAEFTGPGFTSTKVPFHIALSNCETDTGAGFIATAHVQLDGVDGSAPVGPVNSGVFSLTTDSQARGMGIQVLEADGSTPMELQTEVPLIAITPGNM